MSESVLAEGEAFYGATALEMLLDLLFRAFVLYILHKHAMLICIVFLHNFLFLFLLILCLFYRFRRYFLFKLLGFLLVFLDLDRGNREFLLLFIDIRFSRSAFFF